jgi:hypothetical protein
MENSYLPNVPEKNPAPPARQSTVCGADLIYISICSGGRNNQNQRGRTSKLYSRTTHHLRRCNLRFNFGRSNTLVGKLNVSVPATGLGPASDADGPLGAANAICDEPCCRF